MGKKFQTMAVCFGSESMSKCSKISVRRERGKEDEELSLHSKSGIAWNYLVPGLTIWLIQLMLEIKARTLSSEEDRVNDRVTTNKMQSDACINESCFLASSSTKHRYKTILI